MPIDELFNCPLGAYQDALEDSAANRIAADYVMGWSWGYSGETRMQRAGDRFTDNSKSYNMLIGDLMNCDLGNNKFEWTHRDSGGALSPFYQTGGKYTQSRWQGQGAQVVDVQFGFDDGSVRRYDRASPYRNDQGLEPMPGWYPPTKSTQWKFWIPEGQ